MSQYDFARLRPVEVRAILHQNEPVFFLRDPLQLSPNYIFVPQYMGPILAECDGTQTLSQVQQQIMLKMGIPISIPDVERLLSQLDEVYLLDNDRATAAKTEALAKYRNAPYRTPASAGLSYAANPNKLRQELQAFMDKTPPVEAIEQGQGLFSPHIDYFRGGPVYAQAWKRAAKLSRDADLVVIFGTDHNSWLPGQITPTRQNYATPFGVLPTDQKVVDALIDVIGEEDAFAEEIHHRQEHSIELVATWLHFIRNGESCPIVPILCGSFHHFIQKGTNPADDARLNEVIEAIKQSTAGRKVLAVASGDLAHLGPAFQTKPIDAAGKIKLKEEDDIMLVPLQEGDPDAFFEVIRQNQGQRNVCGTAPFYLTMKLMGEVQGELTSYDCCPADQEDTSFVSVCGMVFA